MAYRRVPGVYDGLGPVIHVYVANGQNAWRSMKRIGMWDDEQWIALSAQQVQRDWFRPIRRPPLRWSYAIRNMQCQVCCGMNLWRTIRGSAEISTSEKRLCQGPDEGPLLRSYRRPSRLGKHCHVKLLRQMGSKCTPASKESPSRTERSRGCRESEWIN